MPQLSNLVATHKNESFTKVGSFWHTVFADKEPARRLAMLPFHSQVWPKMEEAVRNLAGDDGYETVRDVVIQFGVSEVAQVGEDFYDDKQANGNWFARYADKSTDDGSRDDLRYSRGQATYWMLPVKNGIIPFCIHTQFRKLVVGIDFFVIKDEFILFKFDPKQFNDGSSYVVASGRKRRQQWLDYAVGVQTESKVSRVVDYCRNTQTPRALKLALAEICGIRVLSSTQRLRGISNFGDEIVYTFDREVHRVDYIHDQTKMVIGETYPDGYSIGEGLSIHQNDLKTGWWRGIDWHGGFSLDPIMVTKGLFASEVYGPARAVSKDPNGKLHVRFALSSDEAKDDAYWAWVAENETRTGCYINSVIGLKEVGDTIWVEPIDVLFKAMLDKVAMVILIDQRVAKRQDQLIQFLNRELPVNCVALIIWRGPDIPMDSLALNPDAGSGDSVFVSPGAPGSLVSAWTMNPEGKSVDFVTVNQETPVE